MFRKPDHPIRKLLYQFEVRLTKRGFGRQPHETIENWFTRLQLSDYNIQIYQKVRYGGEEVSEEEVRSFKKNLQQINEQLNQNLKKDKQ